MKRNQWLPIDGLPELYVGQYVVPNFASNSVVLRVAPQVFTIVSPGKSLLDDWPKEWPRQHIQINLVMPNSYHYMGVAAWREAFPKAALYASEKAIPRLAKKGITHIRAAERCPVPLSAGYQVVVPPGHRGGDLWITKSTGEQRVWITCDSFQSYERYSNQPIARMMQKLMDTAPGLKMSQVVKWLLLDDRTAFKTWALRQVQADRPNVLIPSHGEVLSGDSLSKDLQALLDGRL